MLIKALAFACLAKAHRDENGEKIRPDPLVDPNFYIDQLTAMKEKANSGIARGGSENRVVPSRIPVILDNEHTDGNWTSTNSTSDDTCSYIEQADGSVLISTLHQYQNLDYCHEYWECENPDHNMFFKWNRVNIEETSECHYDWARFAWGTEVNEQEFLCSDSNALSNKQKAYRNTGGNKIVWDFDTDGSVIRWGAEAQILCKDPADINECIDGTHDCAEGAECIKTSGQEGYTCQCPSGGIKWGDQTLSSTGAGTNSDPCKFSHPDFPSIEIFPIAWDGETLGAVFEKRRLTWQDAFERCNELGMTLPLPSNDAENTALTTFLASSDRNRRSHTTPTNYKRIFLGAHNGNADREWVNLYTGDAMTYNQWSAGQPDYAGNAEKVAEMWTDNGDWNDLTLTNGNVRKEPST